MLLITFPANHAWPNIASWLTSWQRCYTVHVSPLLQSRVFVPTLNTNQHQKEHLSTPVQIHLTVAADVWTLHLSDQKQWRSVRLVGAHLGVECSLWSRCEFLNGSHLDTAETNGKLKNKLPTWATTFNLQNMPFVQLVKCSKVEFTDLGCLL